MGGRKEEAVLRLLPHPSVFRIALLLAVVVGGYVVFSAYGHSLVSHRLSHEEQEMRDRIEDLQRQQEELSTLRDYLQTDDYVEGVARRVLGLVRAGERLYVVEGGTPTAPEEAPNTGDGASDSKSWWERLYSP